MREILERIEREVEDLTCRLLGQHDFLAIAGDDPHLEQAGLPGQIGVVARDHGALVGLIVGHAIGGRGPAREHRGPVVAGEAGR